MFPRSRRLAHRHDINLVLRRGRRLMGSGLTLRFLHTGNPHPRYTVVVGKGVSKRAVIRNRVKRQMRHLLAAETKQLNCGVDIMMTILSPWQAQSKIERRSSLRELLRRSRLR